MPDTSDTANPMTTNQASISETKVDCRSIDVFYGDTQAIFDISMAIRDRSVTAFIGPSGCGKSTFLRCINRMNDTIDTARVDGEVLIDGENVNSSDVDPVLLRSRVGMVFQKPNPFPKSIYDNIAYGPRIHGRLGAPGTSLSGGQQQRLCIARAIAVSPEVILMDEPCSALDPIATAKIEELIDELRERFCLVIVTHSMQQAARVSQRTAFFHLGKLVEYDETETVFTNPTDERTQDYITGRFG